MVRNDCRNFSMKRPVQRRRAKQAFEMTTRSITKNLEYLHRPTCSTQIRNWFPNWVLWNNSSECIFGARIIMTKPRKVAHTFGTHGRDSLVGTRCVALFTPVGHVPKLFVEIVDLLQKTPTMSTSALQRFELLLTEANDRLCGTNLALQNPHSICNASCHGKSPVLNTCEWCTNQCRKLAFLSAWMIPYFSVTVPPTVIVQ